MSNYEKKILMGLTLENLMQAVATGFNESAKEGKPGQPKTGPMRKRFRQILIDYEAGLIEAQEEPFTIHEVAKAQLRDLEPMPSR